MTNVIPLLKDLISIDSSHPAGIEKAVHYCENWLTQHELPVERHENNGYPMLVSEIGTGKKTLILNGHIDVVKGVPAQFSPKEEGDKLYGRGSADMKAGLAAMMGAMAELCRESLSSKVQLQIVPDEETGGRNGTSYLVDQGYTGDFVICGEPTEMGIAIQSKGVLQLDFDVAGSPAHSSRPWEGENAIQKAFRLYESILELPFAKEASSMYAHPSINLAKINGGTVYNKVPEHCAMSLDIRFLPDQDPNEILKQINELSETKARVHICNDPVDTEQNNPYVQTLSKAITSRTELERVNVFGQHGSSDGQYFTMYNIPAVEFGPVGADWHGNNEMVYMHTIPVYQQILIDFARRFADTPKPLSSIPEGK